MKITMKIESDDKTKTVEDEINVECSDDNFKQSEIYFNELVAVISKQIEIDFKPLFENYIKKISGDS